MPGSRPQDPKQFARSIRKLSDRIKSNTLIAIKKAAIAADQTVVLATPVDTGRARSNWLVQIGSPDLRTLDVEGEANTALAQGRTEIGKYKLGGNGIFISNSLPYIERLENGSSAQAPSGMTAQAIQAANRYLSRVKLLKEKGV